MFGNKRFAVMPFCRKVDIFSLNIWFSVSLKGLTCLLIGCKDKLSLQPIFVWFFYPCQDFTGTSQIALKYGGNMEKNNRRLLRNQLFTKSKGWLAVSIITMVMLSLYNLVVSWLLQKIIDIAAGNDQTPLSYVLGIACTSFLIFMLAYAAYRTARPRFVKIAMTQYKAVVFEKILSKRIGAFSQDSTGKVISALTNDMRSVEDYYLDSILTVTDISVSFFGALALMLWYSPALTAVAILLSILPLIVSIKPAQKLASAEKRVSDKNASYVEAIKDILSGFSVIKSFRAEAEIEKRFSEFNDEIENAKYSRRYADETVNLLSTAASVVMRLGIFLFGAWLAVSGKGITPGTVLVFLQLVNFVISPIERMPSILANRKAAIAITDKISDFLLETEKAECVVIPRTLTKGISVRGLSFGYDGNEILKNVNIDFRPGSKYAIVGASGAGKTTLLNLLMQAADNYSGSITFDGVELRAIDSSSLFDALSFVQQNVFVFNDTIYNNVTLYKKFSSEVVHQAIANAGLSDIINSHGQDYICGDNGSALSGGEKQRISIARALLRDYSVLLMDEATAALDKATANTIMKAVITMDNTTRIVVTHRLDENILRQYDEIIYLHHGTIGERGTFDALIAKKALFYSLFTISQRSN